MARDTNNLTITGRATRDAEVTYTNAGTCLAKFSLAVNGFKDEVSFFKCTIWGKTAENVGKYITKGKQLNLEGSIKQTKWQDRETDKTMYGFEINVAKVQLLGSSQNQAAKETEQAFERTDNHEQFNEDASF